MARIRIPFKKPETEEKKEGEEEKNKEGEEDVGEGEEIEPEDRVLLCPTVGPNYRIFVVHQLA